MAGQLGTGWWEQQSGNSVVSSRVLNGTPTDVWLWGVQPRAVFIHTTGMQMEAQTIAR